MISDPWTAHDRRLLAALEQAVVGPLERGVLNKILRERGWYDNWSGRLTPSGLNALADLRARYT